MSAYLTLDEIAQKPITIAVKWKDGTAEEFELPLLSVEDFGPWLAEETKNRKDAGMKSIPANLSSRDRFIATRSVELDVATFADLWRHVQTPEGIDRVIQISMRKAGIPDDKAMKLLKLVPTRKASALSQDLSQLFDPPQVVAAAAEEASGAKVSGNDPLALPSASEPQSQGSAAAMTGSPTA